MRSSKGNHFFFFFYLEKRELKNKMTLEMDFFFVQSLLEDKTYTFCSFFLDREKQQNSKFEGKILL
jgi:uncharacterized protein YqgQ